MNNATAVRLNFQAGRTRVRAWCGVGIRTGIRAGIWAGVLAGVMLGNAPRLSAQVSAPVMAGGPMARARMMPQAAAGQMDRGRSGLERALSLPGIQGRWWVNPRIAEQLKVTDEQQKSFDAILLDHREKLIDLHASLEKAELSMEQLVSTDTLNEAAISAQIEKVAQARAELEKANAHYLLAIWSKLSPEQRTLIRQFRNSGGFGANWGRGNPQAGPQGAPHGQNLPAAGGDKP